MEPILLYAFIWDITFSYVIFIQQGGLYSNLSSENINMSAPKRNPGYN